MNRHCLCGTEANLVKKILSKEYFPNGDILRLGHLIHQLSTFHMTHNVHLHDVVSVSHNSYVFPFSPETSQGSQTMRLALLQRRPCP